MLLFIRPGRFGVEATEIQTTTDSIHNWVRVNESLCVFVLVGIRGKKKALFRSSRSGYEPLGAWSKSG